MGLRSIATNLSNADNSPPPSRGGGEEAKMTFDEWAQKKQFGPMLLPSLLKECWNAAVVEERERCATLALRMGRPGETIRAETARQIALAIREHP